MALETATTATFLLQLVLNIKKLNYLCNVHIVDKCIFMAYGRTNITPYPKTLHHSPSPPGHISFSSRHFSPLSSFCESFFTSSSMHRQPAPLNKHKNNTLQRIYTTHLNLSIGLVINQISSSR